MPAVKQASKRKRVTKAVPALGAVGLTFSLVGGASASAVPTADTPQTPNIAPGQEVILGEEEMSDVSLATFYVFDKENTGLQGLVHEARGCGGCRGCPRLRRLPRRGWHWLPRLWLRRLWSWLGSWLGSNWLRNWLGT